MEQIQKHKQKEKEGEKVSPFLIPPQPVLSQTFQTRTRAHIPLVLSQAKTPQELLAEKLWEENGIRIVRSGLQSKDIGELHIGVMEDQRKIQSGIFLDQVAEVYRDIFGHGEPVDRSSWGEYLKCRGCGNKRSVEDVFQVSEYMFLAELEKQEKIENDNSECDDCGEEMELFYDSDKTSQEIRQIFERDNSFGSFLIDSECIPHGFGYGWATSLQDLWKEKWEKSYQYSSLDFDVMMRQLKKRSSLELEAKTTISYIAEVGEIFPVRDGNIDNPFVLTGTFFDNLPDKTKNLPTFLTTHRGLNSYVLLRAGGCREVCTVDDDDRVILEVPNARLAREFSDGARPFYARRSKEIKKILKEIRK